MSFQVSAQLKLRLLLAKYFRAENEEVSSWTVLVYWTTSVSGLVREAEPEDADTVMV